MTNVKWIFFDVGYTIIDEESVWNQRCYEQSQTDEARLLGLTPKIIFDEIIHASITYQPQYRTVIKKYSLSWQAPYRHELEKPYASTDAVLKPLSQKYRLGIIANQEDGLADRLIEWGIADYFNLVISSWDYQIMKPDVRLFETALEKACCKPSEAVMIGDRLDNDIFPAKSIGMKSIWIKQGFGGMQIPKSIDYMPDREVNNLCEILCIL